MDPPPLPQDKSNRGALRAYSGFLAWILPPMFFATFALLVLAPKAEMMIEHTQTDTTANKWFHGMVTTVRFFHDYTSITSPVAIAIVLLPEFAWKGRPSFRHNYLRALAYVYILFTFLFLVLIAIILGLVGPRFAQKVTTAEQGAAGQGLYLRSLNVTSLRYNLSSQSVDRPSARPASA